MNIVMELPNNSNEKMGMKPADHRPYTDVYFLRSNQILKAENLNPFVRAQVFLRNGPGEIHGTDLAVDILRSYSALAENGGRVFAKRDGERYQPLESVMVLEGRVQDLIEFETMYLGVLAAETTKFNDGIEEVNLPQVMHNARAICDAIGDRPLTYFGARHWRYNEDAAITFAAHQGGAVGSSTDIGAATFGKSGSGTIPHALENIYAWKYGKDRAVVEATKAFDRVIDSDVPRIVLNDYNNKEIDDAIATARALDGRLSAIRVDTCGENVAQGAAASLEELPSSSPLRTAALKVSETARAYWFGHGVTVSGVHALRCALDAAGYSDVKIILTSGFGKLEKVRAFVEAEKVLGMHLFDGLGVGGLYKSRTTTMDIVAVAAQLQDLDRSPLSKVGRIYRPNPRLPLRLGK